VEYEQRGIDDDPAGENAVDEILPDELH